jgi:hypothetical protein
MFIGVESERTNERTKQKERTMKIEFKKHFVKNTETKAKCRVHYSHCTLINGRKAITLYAKSYSDKLYPVMGDAIENDTDMMTDYFEKDRFRIYEGDELYETALKLCA